MKILRYLATTTLLLNYTSVIFIISELVLAKSENIIWWIWASGILNVILVMLYFFKSSSKENIWLALALILTGLSWVFPPLLITYFGIPFSLIYFFITIYILSRPLNASITSVSSGLEQGSEL